MKNRSVVISVILSFIISISVVFGYSYFTQKKIAFVRTGFVLAEYNGMKSANAVYDSERIRVQTNMDTLRKRYDYLAGLSATVSGSNKSQVEYQLKVAGEDYERYANSATDQLEKRRVELTSVVIKEINSTIEAYGKKHHYDIILGSTDAGSLLYGVPDADVTEEILSILNSNYKAESTK